ncbi:MAG: glycine cleavage system aminomethyltransferase GcvT, partial [Chloroflexi bacterium]|nr:glycine cleavage system aminomethyltransferase GcvT [Chloroflexota bacterium]
MSDASAPAQAELRTLALRPQHVAAGARFAPFAGWEMPLQYAGIVAEHEAVRERAGVFDVSHLARVWVEGPGAGAALRRVTTYDVTRLAVGAAHYSLYSDERGGIADDVFAYRLGDERWLVVHNAANASADLDRVRAAAGPLVHDATDETVLLAVQGPRAPVLLRGLLGEAYAALPPRGCAELEWRGTRVLVARTGYTGEDGAECNVDRRHAAAFWEACLQGGAEPVGLGARDTLRLEAALPLHGHDLDASTDPYEAGLGFAVTLDDVAAFTGRTALVRLAAAPPARRLVCVQADERGAPFRAGYAVLGSTEPGA